MGDRRGECGGEVVGEGGERWGEVGRDGERWGEVGERVKNRVRRRWELRVERGRGGCSPGFVIAPRVLEMLPGVWSKM